MMLAVRAGACVAVCAALTMPVRARAAATAATGPVVINVVVTLTTTSAGATSVVGVATSPATNSGGTSTTTALGPSSTTSTAGASTTSTGSTATTSAGGSTSTANTPGCTSAYPQAVATLNTFAQNLLQVETVYQADHAAGVVSDSVYTAGWSNLLGIGLDAGAAHDMIVIGGDAGDIGAQIATVQGELLAVTNTDLVALVGQMQGELTSAQAAVTASAGCAVSVAQ